MVARVAAAAIAAKAKYNLFCLYCGWPARRIDAMMDTRK